MGPPPPNNEQPQPGSDSSRERTRALLGGVGLPDTGATNNADTGVARRGGNTGILVEAGLLACLWATLNALDRVGPTTWPRTRSQPSQKIVELGHDLTFDNLVSLAAAFPNAQVYGIEQSASAVQAGQNALPKLAPKFAPRITLIAADYTTYRDPSLNHQADLVVVVAPFPGTAGAVKQGVDNFVKPGGIVLILTEDDAMKNSFEVLFRTKATLRQPRSHTSILGDPYHYIVGTSIGVPMTSVHFQHGAWEIFVSASGGTMP